MSDNKMSNKRMEKIYNHQLTDKKYDIATLEYNIDRLSLKKLLVSQNLTPEFCVKYLLNPEEHGMCVEDSYICDSDILLYQKHITQKELDESHEKE